jgi:hypothetical protein
MTLNNQLLFHVYEKDNHVVAHTLTADELEKALLDNKVDPILHDIVALPPNENESKDASY